LTITELVNPMFERHGRVKWIGAITSFTGPDGRTLLVTSGDDDTARVWDAATGREVGSPQHGRGSSIEAIASFTGPDGQTVLAVCGSDVSVGICDLATEQGIAVIRIHP
jgi:WD40 repeat protein